MSNWKPTFWSLVDPEEDALGHKLDKYGTILIMGMVVVVFITLGLKGLLS